MEKKVELSLSENQLVTSLERSQKDILALDKKLKELERTIFLSSYALRGAIRKYAKDVGTLKDQVGKYKTSSGQSGSNMGSPIIIA